MVPLGTLLKHFLVVWGIWARKLQKRVATKIFRPFVVRGARKIVTPFTPFLLSHHYLSFEIDEFNLTWLNPGSRNLLKGVKVLRGDIVYCRDDQLQQFCREILPQIFEPFVLITGTGTAGGLPDNRWVRMTLESELLLMWFAQNQVHPNLNIRIFPQGVDLWRTPQIRFFMGLSRVVRKKTGRPLVPYVTVHPHLVSPARDVRENLVDRMDKKRGIFSYLWAIARNSAAISPPGDRDDTFRHWECILLGTFPITNLSGNYRLLFEENMIYRADLRASINEIIKLPKSRPNAGIGMVQYWRRQVEAWQFPS